MLEVRWAKQALADLDHIDDYYFEKHRDFADRIGRAAVAGSFFLAEWPKAGSALGAGPRRKWRVKNSPYVLVYRAYADHLRILRVRHMREDWRPEP